MSAIPPGADRLDQLIVDHVSDVAAYCRWRCASERDAQDAVSEVFGVAWRRLGDVPDGTAGRVWLLATARRVITDDPGARGHRRRLVERLRLVETGDRTQWPVDMVPGMVADALRQLDPAAREILLLAEWEGLTSEEIGAVMGRLAVTVRGRLHRARQRFRTVYSGIQTVEVRCSSPSPALPTAPPQHGATAWSLSEPAHDAQR
ncbi:MAG: sigma-70 family RNA polymerase sigma factor [Actinomycetota bacterium]|nr:sigma-70 family RNA polymerase sigma factor [Actinomycetota bacterium]